MAKKNIRTEPRYRTAAIGWITKAEIEALLASGVQTEAVTHLRRQDIEVAEEGVFQFRDRRENPAGKRRHIAVLVRALNNTTGKPFEPLLVFPAGGRYFVMQGHHRLAAYDAAGWNEPIPVEVFKGSLEEARAAALEDGGKDKLPMSRTEKSNAAWRLVAEGQHSIERTADLGQVSPSTVKTMRTKLREITAAGKDPLEMDWEQARRWPRDSYDPDGGEWLSKKVQQLVQRIKETGLANEIGKHPELFVEALVDCFGYPQQPPTGGPWDPTRNAILAFHLWPRSAAVCRLPGWGDHHEPLVSEPSLEIEPLAVLAVRMNRHFTQPRHRAQQVHGERHHHRPFRQVVEVAPEF